MKLRLTAFCLTLGLLLGCSPEREMAPTSSIPRVLFTGAPTVTLDLSVGGTGSLLSLGVRTPGWMVFEQPEGYKTLEREVRYRAVVQRSEPDSPDVDELILDLHLADGSVKTQKVSLAWVEKGTARGRIWSPEAVASRSAVTETEPTAGNSVKMIPRGFDSLSRRLQMIREAKRQINIETFGIKTDEDGLLIVEALEEALARGIEVNILICRYYDDMTKNKATDRLKTAGARVRQVGEMAMPWTADRSELSDDPVIRESEHLFAVRGPLPEEPYFDLYREDLDGSEVQVLDYSLHEKMMIVDGRKAIVGGRNLEAPYFSWWVDLDAELEGPAVRELQELFTDSFRELGEDLEPVFAADKKIGDETLRIVESKPWTGKYPTYELVLTAIDQAESSVYIDSQYIVLTPRMIESFRAARSRGVDVRILTNSWTTGREVTFGIAQIITKASYRPLLEAGVRIYEWSSELRETDTADPPGFLERENRPYRHLKRFIVDGEWLAFGSYNLTARSSFMESEILFVPGDPQKAAVETEDFLGDLQMGSEEITFGRYVEQLRHYRLVIRFLKRFGIFY